MIETPVVQQHRNRSKKSLCCKLMKTNKHKTNKQNLLVSKDVSARVSRETETLIAVCVCVCVCVCVSVFCVSGGQRK